MEIIGIIMLVFYALGLIGYIIEEPVEAFSIIFGYGALIAMGVIWWLIS